MREPLGGRDYSESRPAPWRPMLGEGSFEINHARFLDALSGKRHAPTKAEVAAISRSQQQEAYRESRKPGVSMDRAAYMRMKRRTDPKYQRKGIGIGHRGPRNIDYDPAKLAAAAIKRRATWDKKLGRTSRVNHHARPDGDPNDGRRGRRIRKHAP
jgi:hypothetical protein